MTTYCGVALVSQKVAARGLLCVCGRRHTPTEIRGWPSIGEQDDGEGGRLRLSNCPVSGATFAAQVLP
jgi:hypothetical protein